MHALKFGSVNGRMENEGSNPDMILQGSITNRNIVVGLDGMQNGLYVAGNIQEIKGPFCKGGSATIIWCRLGWKGEKTAFDGSAGATAGLSGGQQHGGGEKHAEWSLKWHLWAGR